MKPPVDPTPEEIAARKAEINKTWDYNTERRRAGRWGRHYEVPEVRSTINTRDYRD